MIDVSGEAVRKAIASGRLVESVRRDEKGRPSLDPDVALVEWEKHTNQGRGSASRGAGAKIPAPQAGPKISRPIAPPDLTMEDAVAAVARASARARAQPQVGVADQGPDLAEGFARRALAAERRAAREAGAGQDGDELGAGEPTLNDSRARKEHYQAELARLQVEEKLGLLIDAKEAGERWAALIASCKTKLLAIPSKARSRLPKLDNSDVALLEKLVREALEELAQ